MKGKKITLIYRMFAVTSGYPVKYEKVRDMLDEQLKPKGVTVKEVEINSPRSTEDIRPDTGISCTAKLSTAFDAKSLAGNHGIDKAKTFIEKALLESKGLFTVKEPKFVYAYSVEDIELPGTGSTADGEKKCTETFAAGLPEKYVKDCIEFFHNDTRNVFDLLTEECSELIQAASKLIQSMCKLKRTGQFTPVRLDDLSKIPEDPKYMDNLIEEMTHVCIMIAQTTSILGISKNDITRKLNDKCRKFGMEEFPLD